VRAMGGRWQLSTAARSSPEGRSGAAVVIGLGCARQGEKEVQMSPVLSTGTAATMWRPTDGSGGRGTCETGQQGRARAAADVQVTRGEGGSRRWSGSGLHSGGGEVLCTGGSEEQESRGVLEEEERRGGGPKGLCGNIKNLRDPTVK
jgi:hypothetical protein